MTSPYSSVVSVQVYDVASLWSVCHRSGQAKAVREKVAEVGLDGTEIIFAASTIRTAMPAVTAGKPQQVVLVMPSTASVYATATRGTSTERALRDAMDDETVRNSNSKNALYVTVANGPCRLAQRCGAH